LTVRLERDAADERVAILTIDRPDALNALDVSTLTALRDRLLELRDDGDTRAIVLTGEGDRAFAAGADIKYMSGLDPDGAKQWGELGHNVTQLLETSAAPTVAAVNGFALGGGCELALACDIRYASTRAKLGQPEINLGVIPGWGGTQRLARVCGLGAAKELILTGRIVGADEALRLGLVTELHDPPLERALETARLLASKSPLALAAAKRALNHALQGDHVENLTREASEFGELFASEDAKEGLAAFVDKREPRFVGR
jgi:enoyl-CoA hydratase